MRAVVLIMSLLLAGAAYAQNQAPTAEQPKNMLQPAAPSAPSTEPTAAPAESSTTAESVAPTDADEEKALPSENLAMQPGVVTNLNLTYFSRNISDTLGTTGNFSTGVAELKAGYILDFGLFAGILGHYDMGRSSGNDIKTYFVGPTVGYTCSYTGLFASASYHVFGQLDAGNAGKYKKANGLQIDVAYPMKINDSLKFGPQLSYRSMKYSDGGALANLNTRELVPFMGLWYIF